MIEVRITRARLAALNSLVHAEIRAKAKRDALKEHCLYLSDEVAIQAMSRKIDAAEADLRNIRQQMHDNGMEISE